MKKQTKPAVNQLKSSILTTCRLNLMVNEKSGVKVVKELEVLKFNLNSFYISLKELIKESNSSILILVKHNNLQTQIDMSGLSKMQIISFDENSTYIGRTVITMDYSTPLVFLNLGKKILICPSNALINDQIISLKYIGK